MFTNFVLCITILVLVLNIFVLAAVCKIARALAESFNNNPATQLYKEFFVNTPKGE